MRLKVLSDSENLSSFIFPPNFKEVNGEVYKGYGICEAYNYYTVTCLNGVANGIHMAEVENVEVAKELIDAIVNKIGASPIDRYYKQFIGDDILKFDKSKKYMVAVKDNQTSIVNTYFCNKNYAESILKNSEIIGLNLSKTEALKLSNDYERKVNFDKYSDKKFYEFSYRNFGYYAIVVADSEEEAIKKFEEQVCDNEYNNCPEEIDKNYALKKILENKDAENKMYSVNQCLLILQGGK